MNSLSIISIMLFGIVAIDFSARWALKRSKDAQRFKPAGIIALVVMSFTERQHLYGDKSIALKQFLLSMILVIYLVIANYSILMADVLQDAHILQFGLILSPFFILPFFHFLYELLAANPLSINGILVNFHLRGILALILSANIIFITMEPIQNIISLLSHFILAYLALIGTFYLCSRHRKKTSTFTFFERGTVDYLEPSILRYLAAILEFSYYLILIYFFFLKGPLEALLGDKAKSPLFLCLSTGILLLVTAIIVKYRFYQNAPITLAFYEERALPLSFLLFGITTIVRFYF